MNERRITTEVLFNKNAQDEWIDTAEGAFIHCMNVYSSRIMKLNQDEADLFRFGVIIGAVYEQWKEQMGQSILFNDHSEFIEELEKEYHDKDWLKGPMKTPTPIIRITGLLKPVGIIRSRQLYVCATFVNPRGEVVRLEKYCGGWLTDSGVDFDKAQARKEEVYADLKAKCEELCLEIRGGIFEGGTLVGGKDD